jgi:predicted Zn-dependent protease
MMVVYGANYSQDNSFEAQLTQTKQIASYFDTSNSHKLVLVSTKASDLNQFISVKNHFIYVEPLPNWYAHSDDAILSATDYWIKTDNVKFNLVSVPSDSAITVKWIKETNLPASGYTIGNKVIEIGLGDTKCDGVWHPYDQSFISKVLRHELGHALGHKHSTNSSDVMYPIISDKKYILTADASNSLNIC